MASALMALAQASAACHDRTSFAHLLGTTVRGFLPFSSCIAAFGRINFDHLELLRVEGIDYPEDAIRQLLNTTNVRCRSALLHWLSAQRPMVFDEGADYGLLSPAESNEIQDLELGRVAAHGVVDHSTLSGTYFSFGGIPHSLSASEIRDRLTLMVPHLHQAMLTLHRAGDGTRNKLDALTATERELLVWAAAGRSNTEIAQLRGRSEATVRNQMTLIYKKLGVNNRAAATRLLGAGWI